VKILIVDASICVRLTPFIKPGGLITIMKYRIRNRPDGSPVVRGEQLMAAETDPKLIQEIDGILPAEGGGETTDPNPKDPGPVAVPNGGPYHPDSSPVGTK
jgi:hypothetical protein